MGEPITKMLREFADAISEHAGYGVVMPNPTNKHSGAPYGPSSETEELYAIADRIDEEHKRRMDDCRRETRRALVRYLRGVLTDYDKGIKRVRRKDKAEVVRCEDCMYAWRTDDRFMCLARPTIAAHLMDADDYCSRGVRKEADE